MTKLLEQAYLKARELPDEQQDKIARALLSIIEEAVESKKAPEETWRPKRQAKAGSAKGLILYMADDFDAPLDDFKDYM